MRESPPKSCPHCRYDFTGLPAAYRCPECGLEYNPHMVVWRPKNPWRPLAIFWSFLVPTFMATWTAIKVARGRYVGTHELLGTLVIFAALTFFSIVIFRQNRRGRYVAVSHVGVHGRTYYRDVLVPWSEYLDSQLEQRGVRIKFRHKFFDLTIAHVFDHEHEFGDFRESVALAIDRRRARDSGAST